MRTRAEVEEKLQELHELIGSGERLGLDQAVEYYRLLYEYDLLVPCVFVNGTMIHLPEVTLESYLQRMVSFFSEHTNLYYRFLWRSGNEGVIEAPSQRRVYTTDVPAMEGLIQEYEVKVVLRVPLDNGEMFYLSTGEGYSYRKDPFVPGKHRAFIPDIKRFQELCGGQLEEVYGEK